MASIIKGEGNVYQLEKDKPRGKCRKWKLVVSIGRDPMTGKYHQKSKRFTGTYSEAKRALHEFRDQLEGGEVVRRTSWTFNQYAEHYVDARVAAGEIQERTATTLRSTLRTLGYRIGGLKLQEITPTVLETAYSDLKSGKSPSGKCLSGTTMFNVNLSAYLLFVDARKKGLIGANPLDKVPLPRKDTKDKRALPADQYRNLIESLDPTHYMHCAVLLCTMLGMRRSEAVGLSWGDVNFSDNFINVHASCDEHGELKEPKTESGYRFLPMAGYIKGQLMKRKAFQVKQYLSNNMGLTIELDPKSGECPVGAVEIGGKFYDLKPDVPVTANEVGKRTLPHAFSVWWTRNRSKLGAEGWGLHELRHSFLSLAALQGIHPSVMQQLAGHKSAATTMDIYTHVNMTSKRAAMESMQAAYIA